MQRSNPNERLISEVPSEDAPSIPAQHLRPRHRRLRRGKQPSTILSDQANGTLSKSLRNLNKLIPKFDESLIASASPFKPLKLKNSKDYPQPTDEELETLRIPYISRSRPQRMILSYQELQDILCMY